ncbi:MAG: NUDIX hydrolase [Thomasclavelia sp.]|nr:NUDIX hydrolase [Thomasclavelia sp.]
MEKKISGEMIYNGKIISVYKDKVECPNKRIATREVVRHHGGVGIIASIDNKILLVKQFRYVYNEDTIEIPAGKLEQGEDTKEAALRELEEETNYSSKEINKVMTIYPTPGYDDEVLHIYEAKDIYEVKNPLDCDEDEFIDVIFMDIEKAYHKILSGEIKDSKTIAAIQYLYINKKQI